MAGQEVEGEGSAAARRLLAASSDIQVVTFQAFPQLSGLGFILATASA